MNRFNPPTFRRLCACLLAALLAAVCSHAVAQEVINISDVTSGATGTGWSFTGSTLTISQNGTYTVESNNPNVAVNRCILIKGSSLTGVNITLHDVNISTSDCAFDMTGATVNLTLVGDNTLSSGNDKAGLQAPFGSTLTITAASCGSLQASGGNRSAGIGGGSGGSGGDITISGGTVTATGGNDGAGIGGGRYGNGGTIKISGGTVTATSNGSGAGIGGGSNGSGGDIAISCGTVEANGGIGGAGIGGGGGKAADAAGSVTITGGSVKMTGNNGPQPTNGTDPVYLNTLTLDGAGSGVSVTAGSISDVPCDTTANAAAGVYGIKGVKTDASGTVYFYLPATGGVDKWVKLVADGTDYGENYTRAAGNSARTLAAFDFTVSGVNAYNSDCVEWSGAALVFKQNGTYTVSMRPGLTVTTASRIVVNPGVTADITLNNVSITLTDYGDCAFDMIGATVNLTLVGTNTLKSGSERAGLQAPVGSTLNITAASSSDSLQAYGGSRSAGIGGGFSSSSINNCGAITITGGTVIATGNGTSAAGIGGGLSGPGGAITITGGTVTATGGSNGAGIGGGLGYNATGSVTITGGSVKMSGANGPQPTNGIASVYLNTLTLDGAGSGVSVTAGSIDGVPCDTTANAPAGVYGIKDVETGAGGTVFFYLTATGGVDEWVKLAVDGDKYSANYARSILGNAQTLGALPPYSIKLSPTGTHAFPGDAYGYAAPEPLPVTVTNTGNPTGPLTVALSGSGASAFALSDASIPSLAIDGTAGFTVAPQANLAAGTYTETVTVSGDNGITASFDVSFTVDKAEPAVDALDFDLSDIVYSGEPLPVAVTAGTDIAGLGAVTVKYNGLTRLPDEPGTYAITVDIAPGANYTGIAGLLLGYFTVLESPQPGPIHRTVTLPSLADATTRPAAGRHQTVSGQTFEFVLYPLAALAGYAPSVTVDRAAVNGETGVLCTPNADGSYTVRIRAVRQDLTVSIAFPGASTGTDAVEHDDRIWSSGNRVYVSSPRGGQAIIYSLTGTAVRRFDAPPGQTVSQTLPPGIWIVVFDGHRQKTFIQ